MPGRQIQSDLSGIPAAHPSQGRWKIEDHFVELFDELWLPVYRYLLRAGLCLEEAEDAAQEVFLRLFKHLLEEGREDKLRAWAFRVAHNLAFDRSQDRRRLIPQSLEEAGELSEPGKGQAASPEELLIAKERRAHVERALGSLSPRQRQCLGLRMEGFGYREIGEMLGMRTGAVGQSLQRAIRKLRATEMSKPGGR